mgnify:CR=1 FL=1
MPTPRPLPIPQWFTIPVLLLAVLLAGCGPGKPPPEPSPVSVSEYTPDPTSSEALMYAKAEQAFWGYIEARRKYELAGDYSQFPPEMTTYLEGLILETTQISFEDDKAGGLHASGPAVNTTRPEWSEKYEDSVATMAVCQDATGLVALDANGNVVREGVKYSYYAYFRVADDGLVKIFHIEARGDTLCD